MEQRISHPRGVGVQQPEPEGVFLEYTPTMGEELAAMRKLGFQLEGRLRQDNFHNGAYRDTLLMAMFREKW